MKTRRIGKAGDVDVSVIDPECYFKDLLKKSKAARRGYGEEVMANLVAGLNTKLKKEHISAYALAKKAGIRPQVVKRVLNGAPNAEVSTIAMLGENLDMHLGWLEK